MPADVSISRQTPIRELQDEHLEQKASLQSQHESEIRRIRANNKRLQEEAIEAGSAAVNHIKNSTETRVRQIEQSGIDRIRFANEQADRDYAVLKARGAAARASSKTELENEQERNQLQLESLREHQTKKLDDSQKQLRASLEEQSALQQRLQNKSRNEYQANQKVFDQKISEQRLENQTQIEKEQAQAQTKLKTIRDQTSSSAAELRKQSSETESRLRTNNQKRLEEERLGSNRNIVEMRSQAQNAISQLRSETEKRRSELEEKQSRELSESRARYLKTNEKTQAEYSAESQRIQKEGDQAVETSKTNARKNLQKQDEFFQAETSERARMNEELTKRDQAKLREILDEREKRNKSTLNQQQTDFQNRFKKNEAEHRSSLGNQREQYLKALYKQQREFDAKIGEVKTREDDPFYRLQTFEARLSENENGYTIHAKVPAHERDKVDIRVKDDRAWLSATRQFSDKQEDAGISASTNSYQTWRQEFTLKQPILRDAVFKKIDDDGSITITIPKK
jgi:hypothetical protein